MRAGNPAEKAISRRDTMRFVSAWRRALSRAVCHPRTLRALVSAAKAPQLERSLRRFAGAPKLRTRNTRVGIAEAPKGPIVGLAAT